MSVLPQLKPAQDQNPLDAMLMRLFPDYMNQELEKKAFEDLAAKEMLAGDWKGYALSDPRSEGVIKQAGDPTKTGLSRLILGQAERGAIQGGEAGFEMLSPRMAEMMKVARSGPAATPTNAAAQEAIDSIATKQLANMQAVQSQRDLAAKLAAQREGRMLSREIKDAIQNNTLSTPRSALIKQTSPPQSESLWDMIFNFLGRK